MDTDWRRLMSEEKKITVEEAQRYFAISCNNDTFRLLEKIDRSESENDEMIHQIHASCWHWSRIGEPVNMVRGHYMLAKVYFELNHVTEGQVWASRCWAQTNDLDLKDWDYAFSCEIISRSFASQGNQEEFEKYHGLAIKAVTSIEGEKDREICQTELDRGPWFGMKG